MTIISLPFRITEEWPTPIIRDYEQFLDAVQEPTSYLTKAKCWIDRATLYSLNKKVLTYKSDTHSKTDMHFYPLLNFFYHISIAAQFFQFKKLKNKLGLQPTELISKYRQLSSAEKYFALFEAFWVKSDWVEMFREVGSAYNLPMENQFIEALLSFSACEEIDSREFYRVTGFSPDTEFTYVIQILAFFGILTYQLKKLTSKEQKLYRKGYLRLKSLTISEFGRNFLEVLHNNRPFELWNIPYRIELGVIDFSGQDFSETNESKIPEPFFKAFKPLMSKGNVLKNCLPCSEPKISSGTYIFKVSLGRIWRTIAISGKDSLDQLHLAIQEAFNFENDHLYAFSLDPLRLNSRKSFNDPRGGDYPFADEAIIGKLNFYEGQRFLYVFDFGDWWDFDIELIEIENEIHLDRYKIVKKHGESPEQYPACDDEDW